MHSIRIKSKKIKKKVGFFGKSTVEVGSLDARAEQGPLVKWDSDALVVRVMRKKSLKVVEQEVVFVFGSRDGSDDDHRSNRVVWFYYPPVTHTMSTGFAQVIHSRFLCPS